MSRTNRTAKTTLIHICGPTDCPNSPAFEHDNYFGCIPRDFNGRLGTSKTYRQSQGADGKYRWNGGCDAKEAASAP